MATIGCRFCGERLYYHGEPEGKYPVEQYRYYGAETRGSGC